MNMCYVYYFNTFITSKVWRNMTILSQGASEIVIASENFSDTIIRIYKIAELWK